MRFRHTCSLLHTNISPCQHKQVTGLTNPYKQPLTLPHLSCSVDWVSLSRFFARDTGTPALSAPDWQQKLSLLLFDWRLLSWLWCGWWPTGPSNLWRGCRRSQSPWQTLVFPSQGRTLMLERWPVAVKAAGIVKVSPPQSPWDINN